MTEKEKLDYLKEQGIDAETGMRYADDSFEFYEELIALFVEEYQEKHVKVTEAIRSRGKEYTVLIHALKNNAKALGVIELAEMAYAHEMATKAGNWDYACEQLQELVGCWEKTVHIFQKLNN